MNVYDENLTNNEVFWLTIMTSHRCQGGRGGDSPFGDGSESYELDHEDGADDETDSADCPDN